MIKTHPQPSSLDRDALLRCIEDCIDCAATCTSCADACLGEPDVPEAPMRKYASPLHWDAQSAMRVR